MGYSLTPSFLFNIYRPLLFCCGFCFFFFPPSMLLSLFPLISFSLLLNLSTNTLEIFSELLLLSGELVWFPEFVHEDLLFFSPISPTLPWHNIVLICCLMLLIHGVTCVAWFQPHLFCLLAFVCSFCWIYWDHVLQVNRIGQVLHIFASSSAWSQDSLTTMNTLCYW